MKDERWAVQAIEHDGESRYLRRGEDPDEGPVVVFRSRRAADESAAFWREGLGDEVQSVNVVRWREK